MQVKLYSKMPNLNVDTNPGPGTFSLIRRVFRGGKWFRYAVPLRTSKYKPHQGEREKARRRRQMERGII